MAKQARTIALPSTHNEETLPIPSKITATNAVMVMVVSKSLWDHGAAALVPMLNANPEQLREHVSRELGRQPAYAGQVWLEGANIKMERGSAAQRMLYRIIAAVRAAAAGETKADKRTKAGRAQREAASFEVPAEIAALAAKLVAACGEYEQARKLAAQAVAEAFASAK